MANLKNIGARIVGRLALSAMVAVPVVMGVPASASAVTVFADWLSTTPLTANFSIGAVTGSVSVTPDSPTSIANIPGIEVIDTWANYPGGYFTPSTLTQEFLQISVGNDGIAPTGGGTFTFAFSSPIQNALQVHFANLDSATVDMGTTSFNVLSGNAEFEVSGSVINAVANQANNFGCEDSLTGSNPNGGCGTIELAPGTIGFSFDAIDQTQVLSIGDGFRMTFSTDVNPIPVPGALPLLAGAIGLMGFVARNRFRTA